jgi:hypothetical protein
MLLHGRPRAVRLGVKLLNIGTRNIIRPEMIMDQIKVGSKLMGAGRLERYPLMVYASDSIPDGAVHISKVDRCVSHAMYAIANENGPAVYLGEEHLGGCCPGGQFWLGYTPMPKGIEHFISTGSPTYRNGAAEFYKKDPEITMESMARVGKLTPPGKFISIAPFNRAVQGGTVLSVLCFGRAENIRNLIGLAAFGSSDTFATCIAPWGPACASMITYAAGMAENTPKGSLIAGTTDPTVNEWLPPDMMTLAIPIAVAERMAEDADASFIFKRPKVAYPEKRVV